jgi:hypothetical protein
MNVPILADMKNTPRNLQMHEFIFQVIMEMLELIPLLVTIDDARSHSPRICASADEEQDHEQE